jgi:LytS/YehU family sensor histidine kinase
MAISLILFIFLYYLYNRLHILGYYSETSHLGLSVVLSFIEALICTMIWEADYTFKQWKESLAEKEKLEQNNLYHEFEKLKSQVNPHFLFNCFNTLSSLITEDKKQAEEFLNELSKVYRYLLRINEDGLSRLEEEVKFAESYFQLLKTRYGDAIQMSIEIDKKYEQYLIPTLSLQLLIENAVKHNTLTRSQPLKIDIFTTSGSKIVINNNLQTKTSNVQSNKVGLENIKNKYELLGYNDFEILKDNKSYTVVLPLIWNKMADQKLVSQKIPNESINSRG